MRPVGPIGLRHSAETPIVDIKLVNDIFFFFMTFVFESVFPILL